MPEHAIFQCFNCTAFSINQVTKNRKWKCKLCGSQQSIRKVFANSNQPKDLRPIVQELNMKRGEIEQEVLEARQLEEENEEQIVEKKPIYKQASASKWSQFKEEKKRYVHDDDEDEDEGFDVVTSLEKEKKSRKPATKSQSKKRKKAEDDGDEGEYAEYDEYDSYNSGNSRNTKSTSNKKNNSDWDSYNDETIPQTSEDNDHFFFEEEDEQPKKKTKPTFANNPTINKSSNSKWSKFV
ncbi:predicted protein [Naegleria gruberi]|uniref:Predicted protein n=1 Tax=Naegleria gruberi TaxID=5762 RepID=D2VMC5_NAEGR|nr:uncharacterized protein NAEGRDRAFT_50736 [Naegleria gruberi]EFC42039.1 predicted protein [Naegleria gruberi]|eukprot:XP_002674783.1 predicted protein [Naegleria gruberi strain NEG-M]